VSSLQALWEQVNQWPDYLRETVGVMGWLDTVLPGLVYVAWEAGVAALVIGGCVLGERSGRLRMLGLLVAGFVVPLVISVVTYNQLGGQIQGRYLLPVLVGLPILGAFLVDRFGLDAARSRFLVRLYTVVLLPLQFVALAFTMVRWQSGIQGAYGPVDPLSGPWHPPLGSLAPLVVCVLGLILLTRLVTASRTGSALAPAEPIPAECVVEVGTPKRDRPE
jgi:hypothetical protein